MPLRFSVTTGVVCVLWVCNLSSLYMHECVAPLTHRSSSGASAAYCHACSARLYFKVCHRRALQLWSVSSSLARVCFTRALHCSAIAACFGSGASSLALSLSHT
jgi:hypothetical protein